MWRVAQRSCARGEHGAKRAWGQHPRTSMALLSVACASFMPASRSSGAALVHGTAACSAVARSAGLVASDHSLLDQVGSLHAAGLQGLIQATRDATQDALGPLRTVAINVGLGALVFGATSAWTAGGRLRDKAKRAELSEREFTLLFLCLCLDLAGDSSYVVGEFGDLVWAPVSALALKAIFGSTPLALLNFIKEALPFSDILPVATLAWLLAIVYPESAAARLLGLDSMPKIAVNPEDGDPANYFNPDRDKIL